VARYHQFCGSCLLLPTLGHVAPATNFGYAIPCCQCWGVLPLLPILDMLRLVANVGWVASMLGVLPLTSLLPPVPHALTIEPGHKPLRTALDGIPMFTATDLPPVISTTISTTSPSANATITLAQQTMATS
jgi:hypothetical protein